ncbi:MAG: 2-oxoacid:acceptor oxidoreductase family protein [Proteobacteria bacterium]|nr:2-oxoacid:acceptor oxidoreductase family protein [Pseudomonadota bacterium]MBU2467322.1 2-oxoacid:acceptor oxidoreductase family protein [Pseudomonadota bacterium]MBU2518209.1 2-oxoacid:acceptor oxidoreductase family protein [Pseudomonadota bacterium]
MYFDTIIAGFGGQGVLLMGNVLAYAAMHAGKQVTYMPVYGVEMRGGTANCTVVISDRPVGSPIIHEPVSAVVMNRPSAEKFGPMVKKKGQVFVNASLIKEGQFTTRAKTVCWVPTMELASDIGNRRLANMVMLGAVVQGGGMLTIQQVADALSGALDPRYHKMIPANVEALKAGARFISEQKAAKKG